MREDRALASVVINNYNYGRYLGQAIESALAQTYRAVEVVVVDDGSTDDSRAVIAGYGERVLPVLKSNGGQASALNAGFAASRGDVICFLDADDALLPTAMERAVECLGEPSVTKVHWPLWEIDASGNRTGRQLPAEPLPEGNLRELTIREGPSSSVSSPTSGNAWARSFLERVLPVPEPECRISADAYLFGLAPAFGPIKRIEEPQGLYRFHGQNNYWGRTLEERMRGVMVRLEQQWRVLAEHCQSAGIVANRADWERRSYFHQLRAAIQEIEALIPAGRLFILADEEKWGTDAAVAGRPRIPFPEREGLYWGPPVDDASATAELERLRRERGATFLAVAWPAFWWLEHYVGFAAHLRSRFRCLLDNERLIIYDLSSEATAAVSGCAP
jgi:glycosyltransferase involved in cell wall biosynthesis